MATLVTGADTPLGYAVARALLAAGQEVVALVAPEPVARALVDGLRVLPFALRVVGEGHDLVSRGALRLRDVLGRAL